ncbi:MAG TPA: SAM-dependent methyltransferase [Betaproteobacteria bacterium]|nr:SAM-dependent methyltransferase [Betaproteobacteria bacterium]
MIINRFKSGLGAQSLPLSIHFWNGEILRLGERDTVRLSLNSAKAAASLALPTLGKFARCYVEGDIDLEGDLHDILSLGEKLCTEGESLAQDKKGSQAWKWWRHTHDRDRENIGYHYDVSNDFYALWLDQKRVYSCAYFRHPDDTLEAAQEAKLDHICKKLMLQPGESLLDIGCGWGGLVLWAAQNYDVHAVGITLSQNQHDYVSEQVKAHGLTGRVEVRLTDYRDVPSDMQFDKIASVGMFEHVGRGNLDGYFDKVFSLLKPGGLVMNHGITAAGLDTGGLGSGISEFIEDYVFPGGELVHAARVIESLAHSGLECLDAENLRPHYARTLWQWVHRLEAHSSEARRLIGERKYRIWRIYMAGSAHAFDRGWMALFQILAGRPLANGSLSYPFTRDHVYS